MKTITWTLVFDICINNSINLLQICAHFTLCLHQILITYNYIYDTKIIRNRLYLQWIMYTTRI